MAGISDVLREARERAGLSQDDLVQRGPFDRAHVSRAERGIRGMSFERIDRWIELCGFRLAAVPATEATPEEIAGLPDDLRRVILRLVRLLPEMGRARPEVLDEVLDDLEGRMDRWERRYLSEPNSEPTIQDTRAKSS